MRDVIVIRGDKGEIELEVLGRENPDAQDVDDSNWLRVALSIKAGPFVGIVNFPLMAEELLLLRNQLAAKLIALEGTIQFFAIEGNWTLNLVFERTGSVLVTGRVATDHALGNELRYEFHSDPITLEAMVRDLQRIVTAYPVNRSVTQL